MLARSDSSRTNTTVFMRAISQEEEDRLDELSDKQYIYFYGDINLNNKEDIDIINNYNFVFTNHLGFLYSTFDYDKASFKLVDGEVKWGPCMDPIAWFKYKHCLLGKPAKVVVYTDRYFNIDEYLKRRR